MLEHPEDVVFEYGGTPIEKMSTGGYESSISLTIAGMQIAGIKFEEVIYWNELNPEYDDGQYLYFKFIEFLLSTSMKLLKIWH